MRRSRPAGRRRRADGGQATVELALVLPFICTVLLLVVQVGVVVHGQLVVVHAAREAVRAAAVDPHPGAAAAAVLGGTPLPAEAIRVDVASAGPGRVRATVTYRLRTDVPLVGPLIGDVELRASAEMRIEHDGPPP